ncbi:GAF domain-containing protein [Dolichospermum sp. UHCC 0259]|uniref:sensor histidine kinase n=1 Tax=Dolichospermum sp. UHCC 0259 TaxID=2590010 RepID=UPI00144631E1|nr:GAF domain-containing protein [Dolichospermum sp. UHCC 0259]MTJ49673.1 GAF domain-containing protein [Dolichospermum sp. UHCC 0259]
MSNDDQNKQPNKLRNSEQQIVLLGQVLQNLREDDRIDSLIKTTIAYLREWFNYPFIWIALYDNSSKTFYGKGGLTPDREKSYLGTSVVITPESILEELVTQLSPVDIANLRDESRASEFQEIAIRYNIQGAILLPIYYKKTCLGLVLLGSQVWGYLLNGQARAELLMVIGELGILLSKNANKQHNKVSQTSTKVLLNLLENIQSAGNFNKKLEAVVDSTHKLVSPDRTNIYWLKKEGDYFWCRMSNHLVSISNIENHKPGSVGITVQKLSDVYQALSFNQVVWVSEADSSLKINAQDHLLQYLGIKSLLVAPIIWQKNLVGFLSVESHEPKIWTEAEKHFVQGAAGLLSLVAPHEIIEAEDTVKQIQNNTQSWQLRDSVKNQQKIPKKFKEYLNIFSQTKKETNQTRIAALKQIASILEVPLAMILSCNPDQNWAEIVPGAICDHQLFEVIADFHISLEKDILAELALAHNSYLILKAEDLPLETRQWLIIPEKSKVFVMALHTNSESQPTGIVVLADYEEKSWTQLNLSATEILIYQLAWWENQQQILQNLESNNEKLHNLNWYKHRRLEEIHRMSTLVIKQIRDLGIPVNELTQIRYKLLLQQLDYTANSMTGIIKQEEWNLHIGMETMAISNLLKRAVEKVDRYAKEQELWIGMHDIGQSHDHQELSPILLLPKEKTPPGLKLSITGDIVKIELVLHELLITACQRSPVGDRVDIWYKLVDNNYLEVSITDHGIIEPQLLAELNQYQSLDPLFTPQLNQPPGLHLVICKRIIKQLGGELHIYQSNDQKVVSRLVLPLVSNTSTTSTST